MPKSMLRFATLLLLLLVTSPRVVDSRTEEDCRTIEEIVCDLGGFDSFCELIELVDLDWQYDLSTNWTAFVPTDAAFAELFTIEQADSLLWNNTAYTTTTNNDTTTTTTTLTNLLTFHFIAGQVVESTDLNCQQVIEMANGKDSRTLCGPNSELYQKGGDNPKENVPRIIITDVPACNGVLHFLDAVMLPTGIFGEDETKAAIQDQPLSTPEPIGSLTVAPTTPTPSPTLTAPTCTPATTFICDSRIFSTFCSLLRQYGLEDDLEEAATVTIFVPYDSAFQSLDFVFEEDLDFDTARDVLIFHAAVPNVIPSAYLECGEILIMANSRETRSYCRGVDKFQKGVGNDISAMPKLLVKDIPVCNGVIHVVDRVLLPYTVPRH